MKPIHIAYAENHLMLRNTTSLLLTERGFTVTTFENGKEMMKYLHHTSVLPDICIINVHMRLLNGLDIIRQLNKDFATVKVLVYSLSDYDTDIIRMLSHGANGYLIKNGNIDELCKAITAVYEKGIYFDDVVGKVILRYLRRMENGH